MENNKWQLSANNNLVLQKGHEQVHVVISGSNYCIKDTTTGAHLGTVNRARWENILKRLEREGCSGALDIGREMIIDEYSQSPLTEADIKAWRDESGAGYLDVIREEGSEVARPEYRRDREPDDGFPQYQRPDYQRHFRDP